MKLFFYEIRKLLGERLPVLLPLVLLAACFVLCILTAPDRTALSDDAASAAEDFYNTYAEDPEGLAAFAERRGAAVAARLAELREQYGDALPDLRKHPELLDTYEFSPAISDSRLLAEFEAAAQRIAAFRSGVRTVLDQARTNMERGRAERGADLSDPLYQYQAYAYQTYDRVRGGAKVTAAPVRGWDSLFGRSYDGIFLFAALLLFASGIFLPEKRCGMLPALRTYRRGRLPTALAKTALLACGSALLSLLFALVPVLVILLREGYSDPSASVQNVQALVLFPEVWTFRRLLFYVISVKVLAGAAFGMLCGLISLLCGASVGALAGGAALFGACFLGAGLNPARFPLAHALNPYSVCQIALRCDRLYVIQPGLVCISLLDAAPAACFALLILPAAACVVLFARKRARTAGAERRLFRKPAAILSGRIRAWREHRPKKSGESGRSLLHWELKKLLPADPPLLLALLLLFAAWTGLLAARRADTAPNREYRICRHFLLSPTEGDFSEKKDLYALLLAAYSAPDTGKDLLQEALERGEISADQKARFDRDLNTVVEGSLSDDFGYASDLYFRYSRLAEQGLEPRFTDTSGVEPLMTGGPCWPLFAALVLILTGAWLKERRGKDAGEHFERILRSTKMGRRETFRAKLRAGVLITLVLSAGFYGAELLMLTLGRPLRALRAPLCSVPGFAGIADRLSVGGYLALTYAVRLTAALLLAVFTVSVSALSAGYVSAFAVVSGVTLLPELLRLAGLEEAGALSFASFFGANGMLRLSAEKQLFSGSFGLIAAFAAGSAILTLLLLAAAYRKTVKGR